jgi:hypothetical protein
MEVRGKEDKARGCYGGKCTGKVYKGIVVTFHDMGIFPPKLSSNFLQKFISLALIQVLLTIQMHDIPIRAIFPLNHRMLGMSRSPLIDRRGDISLDKDNVNGQVFGKSGISVADNLTSCSRPVGGHDSDEDPEIDMLIAAGLENTEIVGEEKEGQETGDGDDEKDQQRRLIL